MSDFVEQCRSEWKRLGVSDQIAEEMASDLAADLGAAEADGVSAEEFLGPSAFDPRPFAASWAAERGVVPEPESKPNTRRRPRVLVAFTGLAALTLVVAAALLVTGEPKVSLVTTRAGAAQSSVVSTSAAAPIEWILLSLAIVALAFAAWLWSSRGRARLSRV
jgi:hypothetical protein